MDENAPARTLSDEEINQYVQFLPYLPAILNNDAEALPCLVLAGDEDGSGGAQVYAYAEDGQLVISVHYDTAGPDADGRGPWAYYGPEANLIPTVFKAGSENPAWQATAEANPGAETIAQAVAAAYLRGWDDRGVFRDSPVLRDASDAELDAVRPGLADDLRLLRKHGMDRPEDYNQDPDA